LTIKKAQFTKILVFGVILLFIGIGVQPAFAEISIDPDNSELVEITVQFYDADRTYNHTVMLTKEKAQKLEYLEDNFKAQIDSIDNPIETETIIKNAILSLKELGLLPDYISIDYAQSLVTGKEQNPWIKSAFEKWTNKKKDSFNENENILCIILGDSNRTSFAGPVPILLLIHYVIIINRINRVLDWVSSTSKIGELLSNIFKELFREIYQFRLYFWLFLVAGINFLPLKIGAIIGYGFPNFDPFSYDKYPAEGWVYTIGASGKKIWSGSFSGLVLGFTGIKIIRNYFDFFYFGTALQVVLMND
jgi:hypothetical protein